MFLSVLFSVQQIPIFYNSYAKRVLFSYCISIWRTSHFMVYYEFLYFLPYILVYVHQIRKDHISTSSNLLWIRLEKQICICSIILANCYLFSSTVRSATQLKRVFFSSATYYSLSLSLFYIKYFMGIPFICDRNFIFM